MKAGLSNHQSVCLSLCESPEKHMKGPREERVKSRLAYFSGDIY
jgi:hypothetical protein